ncbi:MAG TPA: protein translocase subunit SecD, partial [Alphaproteobacteria bacterium]|nr:protein translocase subunit SecD [Alphaproteobacteria bacterium]
MAPWKAWTIVAICVLGVLYAAPNLFGREQTESWPRFLPHQQVTLGLDLQGGSHLLLEVDVAAVARERLTNLQDAVRGVLRSQRIPAVNVAVQGDDSVVFTVREPGQAEQARAAVRDLDAAARITVAPDGSVILKLDERELAEQRRRAVTQSIEIVRRRIDETGTREPTIQALGQDRI